MTRLAIVLLLIAVLSLIVSWVAEEPGQVAIDWSVYHIEMSVLTLIAGLALLSLFCLSIYWVFYMLVRSPRIWSQSRIVKRQSLGITALTETFAAIASQDLRGARRYLKRAEQLLPDQPLTLMLASQVARLEGNDSKSQLYLERMSKTGVTEFLALRGLIENARRAGEYDVAIRHAEKAYDMKPGDHWLATTLIGLYADKGRTEEALKILARAAGKRALQTDEVRDIRAGILCNDAARQVQHQEWGTAKLRLRDALRRHKHFVPAIVLLADVYTREKDASMALKTAGDGWRHLPHPEIGEALLRAYDVAKDKNKAAKIIRKLAKIHADTEEAEVLMAGLAIKERDFDSARGILKELMEESSETSRLCYLLATVEHVAGNPEEEAAWHRRAKESPTGAVWNCSSCKRPAAKWELSCIQCGSVASLV